MPTRSTARPTPRIACPSGRMGCTGDEDRGVRRKRASDPCPQAVLLNTVIFILSFFAVLIGGAEEAGDVHPCGVESEQGGVRRDTEGDEEGGHGHRHRDQANTPPTLAGRKWEEGDPPSPPQPPPEPALTTASRPDRAFLALFFPRVPAADEARVSRRPRARGRPRGRRAGLSPRRGHECDLPGPHVRCAWPPGPLVPSSPQRRRCSRAEGCGHRARDASPTARRRQSAGGTRRYPFVTATSPPPILVMPQFLPRVPPGSVRAQGNCPSNNCPSYVRTPRVTKYRASRKESDSTPRRRARRDTPDTLALCRTLVPRFTSSLRRLRSCPCGSATSYQDVGTWCAKFSGWSQSCWCVIRG